MASQNKTTVTIRTQGQIRQTIPVALQEELLAVGMLQRWRPSATGTAIETRQNGIIEQLLGVKLDGGFLTGLAAAHNRRAARFNGASAEVLA
jgi:hypothetical protein